MFVCLSVCRGPETQILTSVHLSIEVLKLRSICPSVCQGPKTQIPNWETQHLSVCLSNIWNSDPKLRYPKLRYPIDSRTTKVWKIVPPNLRAQKLFRTYTGHGHEHELGTSTGTDETGHEHGHGRNWARIEHKTGHGLNTSTDELGTNGLCPNVTGTH